MERNNQLTLCSRINIDSSRANETNPQAVETGFSLIRAVCDKRGIHDATRIINLG